MTKLLPRQIERDIGRLRDGHRTLGCMGYAFDRASASDTLVSFDPLPRAMEGILAARCSSA